MSFFQRSTLLLSALSSLAIVHAAPAPQYLHLAEKYAPQFRFHYDEAHFPSTVEYFLSGPVSLWDKHGPLAGAPSPLTPENLGDLPDQGSGTYITNTDINEYLYDFLAGQSPEDAQPTTYVFIAPKDNGVVDLHYWVFSPFSSGTDAPIIIGYHVGDWECLTVRTVNGVAQSVDYHAHKDSGSGTIPWASVPKFSPSSPKAPTDQINLDPNARPVAYVAKGTHGMWSSVGEFTYLNALVFTLQDVTSDDGVQWDTQGNLTVINYPGSYSGSLNWLNYKGNWGNKGFNNCWKWAGREVCAMDTGPTGPLQSDAMNPKHPKRGPPKTLLETLSARDLPSQVLATQSPGNPSYTFYVDTTGAPLIAVQQVCASLTTAANGEPTRTYASSYTYATAKPGVAEYTVEDVPACEGYSYVSSYSIGTCTEESQCSYGAPRDIRVYSADSAGSQLVASVIVHDLDNWTF